MKNPVQTILNAVLLFAVSVLFFWNFFAPNKNREASAKATPVVATAPGNAPADAASTTPAAQPIDASAPTAEVPMAEAPDAGPAAGAAIVPATEKIAYIESGRLLENYQGMKDARRAFEAKAKGWERQNAALVSTFRAAVEDYQKKAPGMSAELKATSEAKLQQLQQESGQQQEKIQRQAQEEEAKLTGTVLESVNKKVETYGKAHGYTLILIAAPSGTIAYGRKDLDITGPVVAYLNQNYRK